MICPEHGKGAGLVLPLCHTETMSLHLAVISLMVAPGGHAVVLVDQAGWRIAGNLSIIALPVKYPGLDPVENIWQFMRDNWLSNRVFSSCYQRYQYVMVSGWGGGAGGLS